MRLAHLSDLHVLDMQGISPWRFFNKRLLGGANLLLGRAKAHQPHLLEAALEEIQRLGCEHVVVSGDLTNLGLESEFARVAAILRRHCRPEQVTLVPGNHDRYTLGAALAGRFERGMAEWLVNDLPVMSGGRAWPKVRLLGPVALIAVDSAPPQPWLVSGGWVGPSQRQALATLLRHPDVESRRKVVLMHHHLQRPPHKKREFPRGLLDRRRVLAVLGQGGVEVVLHGHNHRRQVQRIDVGSGTPLVVCEAGSTTVARARDTALLGKFNVYGFSPHGLDEVLTYLWQPRAQRFVAWKQVTFSVDGAMTERSL